MNAVPTQSQTNRRVASARVIGLVCIAALFGGVSFMRYEYRTYAASEAPYITRTDRFFGGTCVLLVRKVRIEELGLAMKKIEMASGMTGCD